MKYQSKNASHKSPTTAKKRPATPPRAGISTAVAPDEEEADEELEDDEVELEDESPVEDDDDEIVENQENST